MHAPHARSDTVSVVGLCCHVLQVETAGAQPAAGVIADLPHATQST